MQHFYDGQIRRYVTQIMRIFGTFRYKDGKGNLTTVPVTYGDLTRQVGSILRDNSENKIPSAPRMAVYITGLEMDTARLADSTYVSKFNIRERKLNDEGNEYLAQAGKNYTIERLMPTPYILSVSVDIWTTNTDQKLQILEQILTLFNPSLELQTTDNYIDWTSISVLNVENVNFSSRSIPTGTESEIDVATIGLSTPIFISPPAKVKKLGVITNIITAVFADSGLEVNIDENAYTQSLASDPVTVPEEEYNYKTTKQEVLTTETTLVTTSWQDYDILYNNNVVKLLKSGVVSDDTWEAYFSGMSIQYEPNTTSLVLQRSDGYEVVGTISINELDKTELNFTVDDETLPTDTPISGPNGSKTNIDYIIDPTSFDPRTIQSNFPPPRVLILGNIGYEFSDEFTTTNQTFTFNTGYEFSDVYDSDVYVNGTKIIAAGVDVNGEYVIRINSGIAANSTVAYTLKLNKNGAAAWKNNDGSDFVAGTNDIIEWDGNNWHIVFDASSSNDIVFTTNLNTGIQYKWQSGNWILSIEGEYPNGTYRFVN